MFDPQLLAKRTRRPVEVEAVFAGEQVADSAGPEPGEVRVRHLIGGSTTIGSPPMSLRPQAILPWASATIA
jgi:hypothetical protein